MVFLQSQKKKFHFAAQQNFFFSTNGCAIIFFSVQKQYFLRQKVFFLPISETEMFFSNQIYRQNFFSPK